MYVSIQSGFDHFLNELWDHYEIILNTRAEDFYAKKMKEFLSEQGLEFDNVLTTEESKDQRYTTLKEGW